MFICYIDESGTPEVPGTSSHFVLAGLSIPIENWRAADLHISQVMGKYGLQDEELHTAWIARKYLEQSRILNFDKMDWSSRRSSVERERAKQLLILQKSQKTKAYRQAKKTTLIAEPILILLLMRG